MSRLRLALDERLPRFSRPKLPAWRWSVDELISPSSVTLAVAGGGLRLTVVKGRELIFWEHFPLPPGLLRHGWIADPDLFGVALRDVLHSAAVAGGRLRWALPGTIATARLLKIKLAGVTDPNALIAREAAWAMPVTPQDHYLYWQTLDDEYADHVFVLAVQKWAVDGLVQACAVANVRPHALDLKPLALALAIGKPDAVIADVEPTSIDVVILLQGLPAAMRSLHLSDVPLDPGFVRAKLIDELSMAIQLYDETNHDAPLDRAVPVYLTGDLVDAELAGKVAYVTKRPTVEPEAPFSCPPGFPVSRFMVNLGLLLKRT